MNGRIHSVESFGTVDGPGIRFVVFLQGCPMRCLYCHNPDTWDINGGHNMTAEEIIEQFLKNRSFYNGGGITVTGGEPLLQTEFITELFSLAKMHGIHTCIDTSGIVFNPENTEKIDELLALTDLVMLDIKHIDAANHKALTGCENHNILSFAKHLEKLQIPVWIRHIVVEGYTDDQDDLYRLGEFIGTLSNLKALDVLPYHTMGVSKYKELGLDYPLADVSALPLNKAVEAKQHILNGIKSVRK